MGNSSAGDPHNKCGVIAGRLRINAATEIQVRAEEFSGRCYLHVRQYFLSDGNEFLPTQKGISLPIEKLELALDAVRELRALGDKPGTAAVVEKSNHEEIRFCVVSWQGNTKADIRSYFSRNTAEDKQP